MKISTYDVYNNKYISDVDNLNISVHIYGIAMENDKILISPQYDGYDFPGGTAEKGENHIETLIREFKEETGYLVKPIKLLNVYTSFFHHQKRNKDYQSYLIYYLVKIVDGEISNEGFDEDEKEKVRYNSIALFIIYFAKITSLAFSSSVQVDRLISGPPLVSLLR